MTQMSFKGLRFLTACLFMSVLAACSSSSSRYEEYPTSYQSASFSESANACSLSQRSRIRLRAPRIRFISTYNPLGHAPNVEHELLVVPEQLIHKWAENRFDVNKNASDAAEVRFTIRDAGITSRSRVVGSCFKEIKEEYIGRFEVEIQFVSADGNALVTAKKAAQIVDLTDPNLSAEERENELMLLSYRLVKKLSQELDTDLCSPSFNDYIDR